MKQVVLTLAISVMINWSHAQEAASQSGFTQEQMSELEEFASQGLSVQEIKEIIERRNEENAVTPGFATAPTSPIRHGVALQVPGFSTTDSYTMRILALEEQVKNIGEVLARQTKVIKKLYEMIESGDESEP